MPCVPCGESARSVQSAPPAEPTHLTGLLHPVWPWLSRTVEGVTSGDSAGPSTGHRAHGGERPPLASLWTGTLLLADAMYELLSCGADVLCTEHHP